MRLFTATFGTETNTFAPLPTNLKSFEELIRLDSRAVGQLPPAHATGTIKALRDLQYTRGIEPLFGLATYAQPGGLTTRATFEALRDELLDDLRASRPVDGVVLHLHGAMVADGYDDCEGEILTKAREVVGASVPIGLVIDPHCHLSAAMTQAADAIICYKEYPHTDVDARCLEMATLVADMVDGSVAPAMSVFDCRMIAMFHTTEDPMKAFVSKLRDIENRDPAVLSISVAHGFPWGDVAAMGTKVLVITDNAPAHGRALAEELGHELFSIRNSAKAKLVSVDEAVEAALASTNHPVVIADASDNPGGGAPSDSTHLIRALMARGAANAAAAFIWDPHAVSIAGRAGEGTVLDLRIGGKTSPLCGAPLDLRVKVKKIVENAQEDFAGVRWNTGEMVCVEANGFELVLIAKRIQCFTPAAFEQAGINPAEKEILVVKSSQHFYAGFAPIAGEVIYADPKGVVTSLLETLPYHKIQRPKWPFDEAPFGPA